LESYALKHEAYAMTPATGAIIWMRSQNAEPAQEERSRAFIETERMSRELQRPSGVHLAPLWRDLGHFRAKLRRLTAAAPWRTGSDLERRSFLWRCCPQDAHRRLAMPMPDRTTAAAKLAQTLIVGRSTRHRPTKGSSWQNGLDSPRGPTRDLYENLQPLTQT
jgi:hypothetical protein